MNISSINEKILRTPNLRRIERLTSTSSSPGLSIMRLVLIKVRVVTEYILRFILELSTVRKWKKQTKKHLKTSRSETALVLANGPSLRSINVEKVIEDQRNKNMVIFAVNFFLQSELSAKILPDYLVLSDPFTAPSANESSSKQIWASLKRQPTITIIVPRTWRKDVEGLKLQNRVLYFEDLSLEGWSKNTSPLRARGYMSMTAIKALAFANACRYKQIYILGFDNSLYQKLMVTSDNEIHEGANHLKGTSHTELYEKGDFYPNGVSDYFYDLSRIIAQFHLFKKSQKITNLDPTSITDAFPKVQKSKYVLNENSPETP